MRINKISEEPFSVFVYNLFLSQMDPDDSDNLDRVLEDFNRTETGR